MPKPLLLARPSGLYARFFVPTDLQGRVGSRYLVRPLHLPPGDAARLVAARLGLALSQAFDVMRKGIAVDLEELLKRVREGELKELTLSDVVLPDGTRLGQAQIDSPEDAALFADVLRTVRSPEPTEDILVRAERRRAQVKASSERLAAAGAPRLSKAIADHLGDLERARLNQQTIIESRHTLRLFAGILIDDLHVNRLTQDHVRAFFDGVRWWPSNATKREPYRDKSVPEVIALAKANQEPEPAAYGRPPCQAPPQGMGIDLGRNLNLAGGPVCFRPLAGDCLRPSIHVRTSPQIPWLKRCNRVVSLTVEIAAGVFALIVKGFVPFRARYLLADG